MASGLSKAAYCRKHNVNYHQFSFWYSKFHNDEHKSSPFVTLAHTVTNTTTTGKEYPIAIDIGGIKVKVMDSASGASFWSVIDFPGQRTKKRLVFGPKREKVKEEDEGQLQLFNEAEAIADRDEGKKVGPCRCDSFLEEGHREVLTAPQPKRLLPGSQVSERSIAYVIVSKYCDVIPLYRQEEILQRYGIDIPRATISHWVLQVGAKCQRLYELMILKTKYEKINFPCVFKFIRHHHNIRLI